MAKSKDPPISWKRKEKEYTLEESISMARKEFEAYWFGSKPLLIGLEHDGKFQAFPLDNKFIEQTWLVIVVDPVTFLGESILECVREWDKLYRTLSLNILLIYSCTYQFQKNEIAIERWAAEVSVPCIRFFDLNSTLVSSFQAESFPKLLIFREGKKYFEYSGENWIYETDSELQKVLRMNDPGLPLLPVLRGNSGVFSDCETFDFRSSANFLEKLKIFNGTFTPVMDAKGLPVMEGTFSGTRPAKMEEGVLFISGKWSQDSEKIWTSDPQAMLAFRSSGSEVAVLAQPHGRADEMPIMIVELDGHAPYDRVRGNGLKISETSELIAYVKEPRLYSVLKELPPKEREVTLKFGNANKAPIEIYGIRCGAKLKFKD